MSGTCFPNQNMITHKQTHNALLNPQLCSRGKIKSITHSCFCLTSTLRTWKQSKFGQRNMQSSCCVNEGAASYIYCLVHIHSSVWRYHHHQERNERKPAQVVVRMFQLSLLSPMGGPVTQFNILLQQLPPKVTPTPTVASTCGPFPWE